MEPSSGTIQGFAQLAWLTFDSQPRAASKSSAGTRQVELWHRAAGRRPLAIYQTTGGLFDTATPASKSTVQVGIATVTFADCATATLMYSFTSGDNSEQSAKIALKRISAG